MQPETPETNVTSQGDSFEPVRERAPPRRIGPYRVDGPLGRGGMGEVYRAWDPRLERAVAIKRILSERASASTRARFWREARVLAALKHPGLVALHDIGEDEGALYIAMELIDGEPLVQVRGARLEPEAVAAIVLRVARALAAAHAVGIVHRDIKLSNILIERSGEPRLIDFGLARRGDDEELTAEGAIVGTWTTMAPEQITGEAIAPATDVHALGVLAFGLLTGASPYERDSREATAAAILASTRPDLATRCPEAPRALAALVDRMLARDPRARPASASEVATALAAIVSAEGWSDAPEVIRRALAAVPIGVDDAGLPASRVIEPTRRPSRRRAWPALALVGTLAIATAALVWRSLGDDRDASSDAPDATSSASREPTPRALHDDRALGAQAMVRLPRKVVAVLPRVTDPGSGERALASAEVIRRALARAPDDIVPVTWRELAARAPGVEPTRYAEVLGSRLAGVDALVEVAQVTHDQGPLLRARLRLPSATEPLATWEVDVPAGAPMLGARSLGRTLTRALGASEAAIVDEGPIDIETAVSHVVRAELAAHRDHWRTAAVHVAEAEKADPRSPYLGLASVEVALAEGRVPKAKAALAALRDDPRLPPRDRSFADIQLASLDGRSNARRELLDVHLGRFPRDVDALVELVHLDFLAVGAGKLRLAAERADRVLDLAPATPIIASKLVRAHGWLGEPERARARLAAHGLEPTTPGLAYVFGELALYERDYRTAARLLRSEAEGDGDLALYPAHMLVAAHMLAGDCKSAEALARKLATSSSAASMDWTWFLLYNALVGRGDLVQAEGALRDWPDEGRRPPSFYRSYDRIVLGLVLSETDALFDELLALEPEPGTDWMVSYLIARYARDPEMVSERVSAVRALYSKRLSAQDSSAPAGFRMIDALEARQAHLVGDDTRALELLAGLARVTTWEIRREGDMFERGRWMAAWASTLDEIGERAQGELVWRELRSLGYERLLAMDTTYEADRRLASAR